MKEPPPPRDDDQLGILYLVSDLQHVFGRGKSCRERRSPLYTIQAVRAAFSADRPIVGFAPNVDLRMTMSTTVEGRRQGPGFRSPDRWRRPFPPEQAARQRRLSSISTRRTTPPAARRRRSISPPARPHSTAWKTLIVGISPDAPAAHDKFKAKHDLSIALAADEEKSAGERLWRVGGEVDVRAQIHGRRALDLPRRRRRQDRQGVAEREGPGARRGGAGGRRAGACGDSPARRPNPAETTVR